MPLFWNSILIKSSFNWFKIELCLIILKKKKKIAWNSSSWSLSSVPIAAFKEIYSGFKWNSSSMNSSSMQFFYFIFKFDRPKPIVVFRETYSSVLNGTWAPWTQVPCKFVCLFVWLFVFFFFFFFFFKLSLITPYSIFYQLSFSLKLNFEKIEFQNRDILLNLLKNKGEMLESPMNIWCSLNLPFCLSSLFPSKHIQEHSLQFENAYLIILENHDLILLK